MHFVFFTEDQSGGKAMDILIPKILGNDVTYKIHSYRGIGRIPTGLKPKTDANKRILLDRLPKILRGYGKVRNCGTIVVICDLDDKEKGIFLSELHGVLNACNQKPETIFCFAIEEFEAWYLGDINAVKKAYPKAKGRVLDSYRNDSICGTWEVLADAVYDGGSKALTKKGWQAVGEQKTIWAKEISPHMNVDDNKSPSFNYMREKLRNAVTSAKNIIGDIGRG
jgi:hypothetical protein